MRKERLVSVAVLILFLFLPVFPAQEVNVTGTWDISIETSQGVATPSMALRQEGERVSGAYKGRFGESKLEGTLKGRSIKFSFTITFQDQPVVVRYDGTVENDTMKGSATFGDRGGANWTAKRRS